ncbi:unnamed protein product [Durusdinium trenchii]|uniref:Uncharacterized protein n=1 Tax=Durusdinium trenchii TaxID=1381693 RepID=A0ABP0L7P9_9DINO
MPFLLLGRPGEMLALALRALLGAATALLGSARPSAQRFRKRVTAVSPQREDPGELRITHSWLPPARLLAHDIAQVFDTTFAHFVALDCVVPPVQLHVEEVTALPFATFVLALGRQLRDLAKCATLRMGVKVHFLQGSFGLVLSSSADNSKFEIEPTMPVNEEMEEDALIDCLYQAFTQDFAEQLPDHGFRCAYHISAGPGCGKSSLAIRVLRQFSWHGACRYLLATPTKVLRDELAAKIGQAGLQRGQDKDHCDLLYAQTTEMLEEQHPDLLRNIEDLEATLETRSLNELPTLYYHRYRFCVRIPCSSDRATSMCEAVLFDQIPKCCPIVRKNTTRQDVAAVMASHAGLASPSVLPIVLPDSLLLR